MCKFGPPRRLLCDRPETAPTGAAEGPDPELDGIFFHVGEGIEPARLAVVKAVDVAPRVAARMGLSPPGAK